MIVLDPNKHNHIHSKKIRIYESYFYFPFHYDYFFGQIQTSKAQKIKLKLELKNDVYVGYMNPKWYEQIQIKLIQAQQLEGAKGKMQGARFPTMEFVIETIYTKSPKIKLVQRIY